MEEVEEEEEKVEEGPIGIVKAIEYWQRSDSLANKGLSGQSDRAEMPTVAPGGGGRRRRRRRRWKRSQINPVIINYRFVQFAQDNY